MLKARVKSLHRRLYTHSILGLALYPYIAVVAYWFVLRGVEGLYFYNHFQVTNGLFNYFFLTVVLGGLV